jgi:type IV pilus assembly protein PilN
MIKINLLPVRVAKKKESVRQQISIFCLSVVGVLVLALGIYMLTVAKISAANDEIVKSEQEITQLKAKIGEIDNIKKFQAEVKKKLDILNQLRRGKSGPGIRLAKLSNAVPEKLWLTRYTENGGNVSLGGIAYNEDLIAAFMRNLQASGEFMNVELGVSEQIDIHDLKAKRFEISCSVILPKVAEPAAPQKK